MSCRFLTKRVVRTFPEYSYFLLHLHVTDLVFKGTRVKHPPMNRFTRHSIYKALNQERKTNACLVMFSMQTSRKGERTMFSSPRHHGRRFQREAVKDPAMILTVGRLLAYVPVLICPTAPGLAASWAPACDLCQAPHGTATSVVRIS